MNVPMPVASKVDLKGLIDAIAQTTAEDSMTNPLTAAQWEVLSSYLLVVLPPARCFFSQAPRTAPLSGRKRQPERALPGRKTPALAIVGAGSVVGEALSSRTAHSATVQASAPTKLWTLTAIRFTRLTNRQPAIALGLAYGRGCAGETLGSRRRRVAATRQAGPVGFPRLLPPSAGMARYTRFGFCPNCTIQRKQAMSLFSWFSRKPAPAKPRAASRPSGLFNADATVPPGNRGARANHSWSPSRPNAANHEE